jgi:hypothetical protein
MKNITTLLIVFILLHSLISCSSDDDKSTTGISAKINGASKTFINTTVTEQVYEDYSDFVVLANQSDDASKSLSISLGKNSTGPNSVFFIQYRDGDMFYQASGNAVSTNITESTDTKIKGTFSGVLTNGTETTVTITNGIVDINH